MSGTLEYSRVNSKPEGRFFIKACPYGECPINSTSDHSCRLELVIPVNSDADSHLLWLGVVIDLDLRLFISHFRSLFVKNYNMKGSQYSMSSQILLRSSLSMTPNLDSLRILTDPRHGLPSKALEISSNGTIPVPKLASLHIFQRRSCLSSSHEAQAIQLNSLAEALYQCIKAREMAATATANETYCSLQSLHLWPPYPEDSGCPLVPSDPSVVGRLETLIQDVKVGG